MQTCQHAKSTNTHTHTHAYLHLQVKLLSVCNLLHVRALCEGRGGGGGVRGQQPPPHLLAVRDGQWHGAPQLNPLRPNILQLCLALRQHPRTLLSGHLVRICLLAACICGGIGGGTHNYRHALAHTHAQMHART